MGAPMGPIQIIPPGMIGLLQIKHLGRLPDELLGQVAPSLEMRDWYMQARQVDHNTLLGSTPIITGGFNTVGLKAFTPQPTPPPGQAWYVEQCTVFGTLAAAADTCRVLICKFVIGASSLHALGVDYNDIANAQVGRNYMCKADRPFWLQPGEALALQVNTVTTATNVTATLEIKATSMQI